MKKLELNQMVNVQGGDFGSYACSGFGIGLGVSALVVSSIPGLNVVALTVGLGCLAYEISKGSAQIDPSISNYLEIQ